MTTPTNVHPEPGIVYVPFFNGLGDVIGFVRNDEESGGVTSELIGEGDVVVEATEDEPFSIPVHTGGLILLVKSENTGRIDNAVIKTNGKETNQWVGSQGWSVPDTDRDGLKTVSA